MEQQKKDAEEAMKVQMMIEATEKLKEKVPLDTAHTLIDPETAKEAMDQRQAEKRVIESSISTEARAELSKEPELTLVKVAEPQIPEPKAAEPEKKKSVAFVERDVQKKKPISKPLQRKLMDEFTEPEKEPEVETEELLREGFGEYDVSTQRLDFDQHNKLIMLNAEKKRKAALSISGAELTKKKRDEERWRTGGFQRYMSRRRGSKAKTRKWAHIDSWIPIETNDAWEEVKRKFCFSYDTLQEWRGRSSNRDEAFLEYLLTFYPQYLQKWINVFDNHGYQMKAPGHYTYPPPRFSTGFINEAAISKEVSEISL